MIRAAIIGVGGRMGRALVRAAAEPEFSDLLTLAVAVASSGSPLVGEDVSAVAGIPPTGVRVSSATDLASVLRSVDVAIDFSSPLATQSNLAACRAARKALLIGTTGFSADLTAALREAAKDIPLLVAHFLEQQARESGVEKTISDDALKADWIPHLHEPTKRPL